MQPAVAIGRAIPGRHLLTRHSEAGGSGCRGGLGCFRRRQLHHERRDAAVDARLRDRTVADLVERRGRCPDGPAGRGDTEELLLLDREEDELDRGFSLSTIRLPSLILASEAVLAPVDERGQDLLAAMELDADIRHVELHIGGDVAAENAVPG